MVPLDLLAHNLLALLGLVLLLLALSQFIITFIFRFSDRILRLSAFKEITAEDRRAFRRQLRRRALVWVSFCSLALLAAALVATYQHVRALDLAKAAMAHLLEQKLSLLKTMLPAVIGIIVGAFLVASISRALVAALGAAIARSERFSARRDVLANIIQRLQITLRTLILCTATIALGSALGLPSGMQRAIVLGAYVLGAFQVSRLMSLVMHLLVDLAFDMSERLGRLESPLRHVASLGHLSGITKRALDYFVYVQAATWTADEFTPNTWLAKAGRVGIRVIAIFYTSRVVVDLCNLFIKEIFLVKAEGISDAQHQQRLTLLPVAEGFLRYGIYFSALVMVLEAASIDPTPLLAGAGVLGVAIGFGSQVFVGDIVAGFFILFENLLLVGDLVEVGDVQGKVEEIGVRITKIRDDAGVLHAIPNGEVRKVANHSKAYVNAVVDVYVPYEEDLSRVRSLLLEVSEKVLDESERKQVEVKVQELGEGAIMLRVVARVPPGQDDDTSDALRAAIVDAMRAASIGAPRARQAVLIDSALRVGAPRKVESKEEEDSGPPTPFSASNSD